jgi:hypothetical protein
VTGASGPIGATGPTGVGATGATGPTGPPTVVTSNLNYYISTTGSDSTGTGASGSPWATVGQFLTVVGQLFIPPAYTVTLNINNGTYTSLAPITYVHPCGSQIIIQGINTYSTSITSVASSSGSAGNWSVVVNVSSVANIAVGDYALIATATGGIVPLTLVGCHKITAVGASTLTLAVLEKGAGVASGGAAANVTIIKSVLSFSGTGFNVGSNLTLKNVVLVGPASSNYTGIYLTPGGSTLAAAGCGVFISNVGLSGFAYGAMISDGYLSNLGGVNCVSGSSQAGIQTTNSVSAANLGSMAVTGCATGLMATRLSFILLGAGVLCGNTTGASASDESLIVVFNISTQSDGTDYSPALNTVGNGNSLIATT